MLHVSYSLSVLIWSSDQYLEKSVNRGSERSRRFAVADVAPTDLSSVTLPAWRLDQFADSLCILGCRSWMLCWLLKANRNSFRKPANARNKYRQYIYKILCTIIPLIHTYVYMYVAECDWSENNSPLYFVGFINSCLSSCNRNLLITHRGLCSSLLQFSLMAHVHMHHWFASTLCILCSSTRLNATVWGRNSYTVRWRGKEVANCRTI
jgi:hypothetical protein